MTQQTYCGILTSPVTLDLQWARFRWQLSQPTADLKLRSLTPLLGPGHAQAHTP